MKNSFEINSMFQMVEDASEVKDVEVVHIGNNSSIIQNATFQGNEGTKFENSIHCEQQINMMKKDNIKKTILLSLLMIFVLCAAFSRIIIKRGSVYNLSC